MVTRRELRRLGASVGESMQAFGRPIVRLAPASSLTIGDRVVLTSSSAFTALGVNHPVVLRTLAAGAEILIGDDVGISGASICAARSISIGEGVLLGANVTIVDTDFHPIESCARRYAEPPEPSADHAVVIGHNAFIGAGAYVLKGARIGEDAVIGAGAVVAGHVPAGAVFAGNPARAVR